MNCVHKWDGIWALGEVNGRGAFTHTSYNDFEIVAANLLDGDHRRVTDRITCYGLFIDLRWFVWHDRTAGKSLGRSALIGTRPMSRVGRAREFGDTRGFMKVLVDAETEEILGAALLGLNGDEAVHSLLNVMYAGQPYTVISRSVPIHPTVSELIPTMLQGLRPLSEDSEDPAHQFFLERNVRLSNDVLITRTPIRNSLGQ